MTVPGRTYNDDRERYLSTICEIRPTLLDDQVKLNDPGASQYLIETLAQDGWNGLLRFYEGEVWRLRNRPGDDVRAEQSYSAAVVYPDAPADAWRWHGISLMKRGRTGGGEGGVRPLSHDEARCTRRRLGAADGRLSEAMMMKPSRQSHFLPLPLALAGCGSTLGGSEYGYSPYALVRVQRVSVGDGNMSVVAPRPYNRHRRNPLRRRSDVEDWTQNGPILDGISFVSGMKNNRELIRQRRSASQQVPRSART